MADRITKPELLAPAGREDVFHAVLAAGADAVYLAGKAFNMRRHRRDYNFTASDLERLVPVAQGAGRRVYVTVNTLVGETELPALLQYLRWLDDLGVDALIVQDLAVLQLCREAGLRLPLHASTMMNVGSAAQALWLREHGVTRVVTSRDVTLEQIRRLREVSGLEVEAFVHGDLCAVQSGQCLLSGIVFGKSSNRGQCLKPCRWAFDLVSLESGAVLAEGAHLLAAKDLCLAQHLPALLAAGIDSLKIEGRMRSAETLAPLVALYRAWLDQLVAEPLAATRQSQPTAALQRRRVRDLTTGWALGTPGPDAFDHSGQREPIFLSRAGGLRDVAASGPPPWPAPAAQINPGASEPPALSATVGSRAVAEAVLEAGVGSLVLCWEGDLTVESSWTLDDLRALSRACRAGGVPLAMTTPRCCTDQELADLDRVLEAVPEIPTWRLTSPAPLARLRQAGRELWAGTEMNLLNSAAVRLLAADGVGRVTPSLEASLAEIATLAAGLGPVALDLVAYGPLTAMVFEHCLIAMATQGVARDQFCQMPCAADRFGLRDRRGHLRPLRVDRYCRSHLLLEKTLCILPALERFLSVRPASLTLDLRLLDAAAAAGVVRHFQAALADPTGAPAIAAALGAEQPAESFTYGAYLTGITGDEAISRLDLLREELHADPC